MAGRSPARRRPAGATDPHEPAGPGIDGGYAAAATAALGSNGQHTLEATEAAVAERLAGLPIDMAAMAVVSNIYRAAGAVRNHVERTVLAPHDLTWTGWVVLWVIWIWGDIESRHVAAEAGISKGTLTGVAGTLTARGLVRRRVHPDDARRVLLSLTPKGEQLMTTLFPDFNAAEASVTAALSEQDQQVVARALRSVVKHAELIPISAPDTPGGCYPG